VTVEIKKKGNKICENIAGGRGREGHPVLKFTSGVGTENREKGKEMKKSRRRNVKGRVVDGENGGIVNKKGVKL